MRWGWGLDGLRKFFRRRRRRRRRHPPGAQKCKFSKGLRMGLPGGRNVRSACTKVFRYPLAPQVPYAVFFRMFPYMFLYIPSLLTPIPYTGAVT